MSAFAIANEATLVARIKEAVNRVVFIASSLFDGAMTLKADTSFVDDLEDISYKQAMDIINELDKQS